MAMMNPGQANSVPPMRPPAGAVNRPQSPGPPSPGQPQPGQPPQGNPLAQMLAMLEHAITTIANAIMGSAAPDNVKQAAQALLSAFQNFKSAIAGGGQQENNAPKPAVGIGQTSPRMTSPNQAAPGARPTL